MRSRLDDSPSLVDVVKTAAEDMVDLLGAQIRLARAEFVEDIGHTAKQTLRVVRFVVILLSGYVFAMAALAAWLARYWGAPGALAVIAGVQLLVGGWGVAVSLRSMKSVKVLDRTTEEASESVVQALAAVSNSGATVATRGSSANDLAATRSGIDG